MRDHLDPKANIPQQFWAHRLHAPVSVECRHVGVCWPSCHNGLLGIGIVAKTMLPFGAAKVGPGDQIDPHDVSLVAVAVR